MGPLLEETANAAQTSCGIKLGNGHAAAAVQQCAAAMFSHRCSVLCMAIQRSAVILHAFCRAVLLLLAGMLHTLLKKGQQVAKPRHEALNPGKPLSGNIACLPRRRCAIEWGHIVRVERHV